MRFIGEILPAGVCVKKLGCQAESLEDTHTISCRLMQARPRTARKKAPLAALPRQFTIRRFHDTMCAKNRQALSGRFAACGGMGGRRGGRKE